MASAGRESLEDWDLDLSDLSPLDQENLDSLDLMDMMDLASIDPKDREMAAAVGPTLRRENYPAMPQAELEEMESRLADILSRSRKACEEEPGLKWFPRGQGQRGYCNLDGSTIMPVTRKSQCKKWVPHSNSPGRIYNACVNPIDASNVAKRSPRRKSTTSVVSTDRARTLPRSMSPGSPRSRTDTDVLSLAKKSCVEPNKWMPRGAGLRGHCAPKDGYSFTPTMRKVECDVWAEPTPAEQRAGRIYGVCLEPKNKSASDRARRSIALSRSVERRGSVADCKRKDTDKKNWQQYVEQASAVTVVSAANFINDVNVCLKQSDVFVSTHDVNEIILRLLTDPEVDKTLSRLFAADRGASAGHRGSKKPAMTMARVFSTARTIEGEYYKRVVQAGMSIEDFCNTRIIPCIIRPRWRSIPPKGK